MAILEVSNLGIKFGGLKALDGFNLSVEEHEIVGLIGPNGSGKTTTFNLLTGVYVPTTGMINFNGKSLIGKKPNEINNSGIARTFQNIRLFKGMTVLENVKIAMHAKMKYSELEAFIRIGRYWNDERETDKKARELLAIFELEDFCDYYAGNLPYGQQRKLEIARALASDPKLLLLDEPAAGMNASETNSLMDTVRFIANEFELAVLLIEHDMNMVMGICERLIVLDHGMIISQGSPDKVKNDPKVIEAYLG